MRKRTNKFNRALKHIKSTKIDDKLSMLEAAPTNNTSGLYAREIGTTTTTVQDPENPTSPDYSTTSFVFEGFLPKKKIDREKILLEISKNEKTTIIYESPKRLRKLLNELLELCGGDREIVVTRELTKKFEEHVGNNINKVIEFFQDKDIIGEITIVIKGARKGAFNPNKSIIKKDLNDLINAGLSLSVASKYLAKKNGLKKSEVYNLI